MPPPHLILKHLFTSAELTFCNLKRHFHCRGWESIYSFATSEVRSALYSFVHFLMIPLSMIWLPSITGCFYYDQLMQEGTPPPATASNHSNHSLCIYWLKQLLKDQIISLSLQSFPLKFLTRVTSTANRDSCKPLIMTGNPCPAQEWLISSYLQTQLALVEPVLFRTWHKEERAWHGKQSLGQVQDWDNAWCHDCLRCSGYCPAKLGFPDKESQARQQNKCHEWARDSKLTLKAV